MSQEILYTSAPQGLKPGSRGFCTVVSTQGMAANLAERLEALSGYRHVFEAHDANAGLNPVNFFHTGLSVGGRKHNVVGAIRDAGLDYTRRTNKLAHLVALDPSERVEGGPAWVLADPEFCVTAWDGQTRILPTGRHPRRGERPAGVCRAWQNLTGDAGWAGVLAEMSLEKGSRPVSTIYRAGTNVLALVVESLSLLPPEQRWEITFSTYFTKLPAGVECLWRFVLDETDEARALRRNPHAALIDLCQSLPRATGGMLVEAARSGAEPAWGSSTAGHAAAPARTTTRSSRGSWHADEPVNVSQAGEDLMDSTQPVHFESVAETQPYDVQQPLPHTTRPSLTSRPTPTSLDTLRRRSLVIRLLAGSLLFATGVAVGAIGVLFLLPLWTGSRNHADQHKSVPAAPSPDSADDSKIGGRPNTTTSTETSSSDGTKLHATQVAKATRDTDKNDTSQPGLGITLPTASIGTKAEPRPLDDFRTKERLDLGATTTAGEANSTALASLVLTDCSCTLEILGSSVVFGDASRFYIDTITQPGKTPYWDVVLEEGNAKSPIGTFHIEDKIFKFDWYKIGPLHEKAELLRYCVLGVTVSCSTNKSYTDDGWFPLSKEVRTAPIPINIKKGEGHQDLSSVLNQVAPAATSCKLGIIFEGLPNLLSDWQDLSEWHDFNTGRTFDVHIGKRDNKGPLTLRWELAENQNRMLVSYAIHVASEAVVKSSNASKGKKQKGPSKQSEYEEWLEMTVARFPNALKADEKMAYDLLKEMGPEKARAHFELYIEIPKSQDPSAAKVKVVILSSKRRDNALSSSTTQSNGIAP